jgi:hypothetical protein
MSLFVHIITYTLFGFNHYKLYTMRINIMKHLNFIHFNQATSPCFHFQKFITRSECTFKSKELHKSFHKEIVNLILVATWKI